jgi:hypothetical protein
MEIISMLAIISYIIGIVGLVLLLIQVTKNLGIGYMFLALISYMFYVAYIVSLYSKTSGLVLKPLGLLECFLAASIMAYIVIKIDSKVDEKEAKRTIVLTIISYFLIGFGLYFYLV